MKETDRVLYEIRYMINGEKMATRIAADSPMVALEHGNAACANAFQTQLEKAAAEGGAYFFSMQAIEFTEVE